MYCENLRDHYTTGLPGAAGPALLSLYLTVLEGTQPKRTSKLYYSRIEFQSVNAPFREGGNCEATRN